MKLLVGLGNPGPKYECTRHNVGFLVVDELVSANGLEWSGKKFDGVCARGKILGEDCLVLKPFTYMNLSGKAVQKAARFFKVSPEAIVVVHDDIDLPWGRVKARKGGGHGGHNGIRSIIDSLGSKEFQRVKLGVGRPDGGGDVSGWVLGKMTDEELSHLSHGIYDEMVVRLEGIFRSV